MGDVGKKLVSYVTSISDLVLVHRKIKYLLMIMSIRINKMHKILVIRLYFPLDALHVSDCISPSSGSNFNKLYIAFGICRYHTSGCCVAIATQQPHVSAYTGIYQMRCTAYNAAPDDGLI